MTTPEPTRTMTGVQARKRSKTRPHAGTTVPAWMRDRAALEQIQRARLLEAGVPAGQILSPGTRRLAQILDQAFDEYHRRLADADQVDIPF